MWTEELDDKELASYIHQAMGEPWTEEEWRAECLKWNLTELAKFSQDKINRLWVQWCASPPLEVEFIRFDHPRFGNFYKKSRGKGPDNGIADYGFPDTAAADQKKEDCELELQVFEQAMKTEEKITYEQGKQGKRLLDLGHFIQTWGLLHTRRGTLGRFKTLIDKYIEAVAEKKIDATVVDPFELATQYLKIYDIILHEGEGV